MVSLRTRACLPADVLDGHPKIALLTLLTLSFLFIFHASPLSQDVFLIIRRKNQSIFLDVKEDTTIRELKAMVAGITRQSVEDMQLAFEEKVLSDDNKMVDYNLNRNSRRK